MILFVVDIFYLLKYRNQLQICDGYEVVQAKEFITCFSILFRRPIMLRSSVTSASLLGLSFSPVAAPFPTIWSTLVIQ